MKVKIRRVKLLFRTLGIRALLLAIAAKVTKSVVHITVHDRDCKFPLQLRIRTSDVEVYRQVFIDKEYEFLASTPPKVIVDAGANIGLASVYFANKYPDAKIIAIEPERGNFDMLKANTSAYAAVIPLQAALWNRHEELDIVDPGLGEWGFMTDRHDYAAGVPGAARHTVTATTVDKLMADFGLERIDILKIDIEGAEREVFSDTAAWIGRVGAIIIELHERMKPGCNRSFYCGSPGFDSEWQRGENIYLSRNSGLLLQRPGPGAQAGSTARSEPRQQAGGAASYPARLDDNNRALPARSNSILAPAGRPDEADAPQLPRIHMFWHGEGLSRVERLAMSSFLAHGHALTLHVYEEPLGVPRGVELADARVILPAALLFRHRKSGSYAMFADWFRYCVLFRLGGIWADTDCVCLQPLRYPSGEVYAWEDEHQINNAILGLPMGHELAGWMADCCARPNRFQPYDSWRTIWRKSQRRLRPGNGRDLVKWGEYGPAGFTAAARHLGYSDRALPSWHFYPVHYRQWRVVFAGNQPDLLTQCSGSSALHLWNEMMKREPSFDKNGRFPPSSLFEQLCVRYIKNDT